MTYKDKTIINEHSRLTVKIKRWREQGKDVSELIAQREALKDKTYKKDKTDTTHEDKTITRKRDKTNKDITTKRKDKTQELKIKFRDETKITQIYELLLKQEQERKAEQYASRLDNDEREAKIGNTVEFLVAELTNLINEVSQIKETLSELVNSKQSPVFSITQPKKTAKSTDKRQAKPKKQSQKQLSPESRELLLSKIFEREQETGITRDHPE